MKDKYRIWGTIIGVTFSVGFLLARALSHAVEDDDDAKPDAPVPVPFYMDERRYPPFRDNSLDCLDIERQQAETGAKDQTDQIAVIGVPIKEVHRMSGVFCLARQDATGLWHPAVPKNPDAYTVVVEPYGDMAALALQLDDVNHCTVLGAVKDGQFTSFRHQRLIAVATPSGLLYDFPNMPIIRIPG
jgi:hypothetical protein